MLGFVKKHKNLLKRNKIYVDHILIAKYFNRLIFSHKPRYILPKGQLKSCSNYRKSKSVGHFWWCFLRGTCFFPNMDVLDSVLRYHDETVSVSHPNKKNCFHDLFHLMAVPETWIISFYQLRLHPIVVWILYYVVSKEKAIKCSGIRLYKNAD